LVTHLLSGGDRRRVAVRRVDEVALQEGELQLERVLEAVSQRCVVVAGQADDLAARCGRSGRSRM
jgi:hypothetical protein